MLIHPVGRALLSRHAARATGAVKAGDDVVFVIDGVPVLVPDAAGWCARYRDSIIASVARSGGGGDVGAVVVALDAIVSGAARASQAPFVDDFTPEEARDAPPLPLVDDNMQDVIDEGTTPLQWLAKVTPTAPVIMELGPGAGGLSAILGARARKKLFVVDISLRSVLLARDAAGARAVGVVGDATALPFADASVDVVVAQNVVDIVDDADALIDGVKRALKPGGRFALTTPDPGLGGDDDDDLLRRLRSAGFVIEADVDGLRWPRVHGPRHVELWTCRGLVARRR